MTVSPIDSNISRNLFGDPEIAPLFSDDSVIQTMIDVEVALARVQGKLGIIPQDAAASIDESLKNFNPDYAAIALSTEKSGVPTIALVEQLRNVCGDAGIYIHWGATSQDIMDTGLMLRLQKSIRILELRASNIIEILATLADAHRQTIMLGRTRSQQATPITFGLKIAGWLDGVLTSSGQISGQKANLLQVQFGGAVGNLAALGNQGSAVTADLAKELNLTAADKPWHTNRSHLASFASHLSILTGCLGKLGQDIVLMCQSEVGEISIDGAGGSSTMPHKSNPIAAETLVSLANFNAGLVGNMHHALVAEHERSGSAWQLEELTLPQMVIAVGAALLTTEKLLAGLVVNSDRMRQNLDATNGLPLAEAATFALTKIMPRSAAQKLVRQAMEESIDSRNHLIDELKNLTDAPLDWDALREPANYLGAAEEFTQAIITKARS